uniref:Uncharacterized protein n=1 Tax=Meloidogyne enterolobii TaxID=390850 RepID=A0A6V7UQA9_MELEN|nr:unnamed protein product [Meloidogyne enterolobii]
MMKLINILFLFFVILLNSMAFGSPSLNSVRAKRQGWGGWGWNPQVQTDMDRLRIDKDKLRLDMDRLRLDQDSSWGWGK